MFDNSGVEAPACNQVRVSLPFAFGNMGVKSVIPITPRIEKTALVDEGEKQLPAFRRHTALSILCRSYALFTPGHRSSRSPSADGPGDHRDAAVQAAHTTGLSKLPMGRRYSCGPQQRTLSRPLLSTHKARYEHQNPSTRNSSARISRSSSC